MMKNNDFVAFILTHGRPEKVFTYNSLIKGGYTGRIVILIDNEDKKADEYKAKFGDKVYIFDKKAISLTFDQADNFNDRRAIVYARNACFDVAKELGYKYFIQLDDDYTDFRYKFDGNYNYLDKVIKGSLDNIFESLLKFYKSIPAKSIAIAQGGDFIGGKESTSAVVKIKRKCMNTFICSTDRPFKFLGRINEDVNTYTNFQSKGNLFLTVTNLAINQLKTQSNSGGMTEIYLDNGTYVKSFYSIMFQPSSVTIRLMGSNHKRLHHSVRWINTVPLIISQEHKKI